MAKAGEDQAPSLLTGIPELPLRERTQQLLGDLFERDLSGKYDSLFGRKAKWRILSQKEISPVLDMNMQKW